MPTAGSCGGPLCRSVTTDSAAAAACAVRNYGGLPQRAAQRNPTQHVCMHACGQCVTPPRVCRYANGNIAELYTLSLRNVHFGYDRNSKPDLMALRPIPGRYIANALESATSALPKRINDIDMSAVQVTKVTHNGGASWVRPPPPPPPSLAATPRHCFACLGSS